MLHVYALFEQQQASFPKAVGNEVGDVSVCLSLSVCVSLSHPVCVCVCACLCVHVFYWSGCQLLTYGVDCVLSVSFVHLIPASFVVFLCSNIYIYIYIVWIIDRGGGGVQNPFCCFVVYCWCNRIFVVSSYCSSLYRLSGGNAFRVFRLKSGCFSCGHECNPSMDPFYVRGPREGGEREGRSRQKCGKKNKNPEKFFFLSWSKI